MVHSSSRSGFWRQNRRPVDLFALLLAVVVTIGGAVAAAWWYAISWHDVTSSGFSGVFVFVGMFACFLGMPAYFVVLLLRSRARADMPKRH